jgi:molybdopterin synthase catalytic subunit
MLEAYQNQNESSVRIIGKYGATAVFVGTMRDFNLGDSVVRMSLEHYPGMAERQLVQIADQAIVRWDLVDVLVIHRVGVIQPGESIMLAAAWAAHRGAAFDACRYIVEELKHAAPFWKKETLERGERWVENNTHGY